MGRVWIQESRKGWKLGDSHSHKAHKHWTTSQPWGRTWHLQEEVKTFNYDDTGHGPMTSQHCIIRRANITFYFMGMHVITLKHMPVCSAVLTRTSGRQGWRTIQTIWDSFYIQVCQCFGNKLCLWSARCLIFPVEQTNSILQTNNVSAIDNNMTQTFMLLSTHCTNLSDDCFLTYRKFYIYKMCLRHNNVSGHKSTRTQSFSLWAHFWLKNKHIKCSPRTTTDTS